MDPIIDLIKLQSELLLKKESKAIEEKDVVEILGRELPPINLFFEKSSNLSSIYKVMDCFAALTKQLVAKEDLAEVKLCFKVAEKILCKGNRTVQNAVENGYLFSLSSILDTSTPFNTKVKGLLNGKLLTEYKRQTLSNAC